MDHSLNIYLEKFGQHFKETRRVESSSVSFNDRNRPTDNKHNDGN